MKKLIIFLVSTLLLFSAISTAVSAVTSPLLIDGADLLSSEEETSLTQSLEQFQAAYDMDAVIITVDSLEGLTPEQYGKAIYDGWGYSDECIVLLVSMEFHDVHINSFGEVAQAALSEDTEDTIRENITPYLSDGNYAEAFETYIEDCTYYVDGYINGFPFPFFTILITALIVGFVISLIVTGIMRAQLKSVRQQNAATTYVKKGSMNVSESRDLFLYRNVTRVKIPKNNSSSGGSGGGNHGSSGKF